MKLVVVCAFVFCGRVLVLDRVAFYSNSFTRDWILVIVCLPFDCWYVII